MLWLRGKWWMCSYQHPRISCGDDKSIFIAFSITISESCICFPKHNFKITIIILGYAAPFVVWHSVNISRIYSIISYVHSVYVLDYIFIIIIVRAMIWCLFAKFSLVVTLWCRSSVGQLIYIIRIMYMMHIT